MALARPTDTHPPETPDRRLGRPLAAAGLALAAAVVLTGCYRVNVSIEVDDDGSGELTMLMAVDPDAFEELLGPMGEAFGDADEFSREELCSPDALSESFGAPTGDMTVEPYDEDGYCGEIRTVEFDDVATVDSSMGEVSGDDGSFAIVELDDGGWRFEATDVSAAPAEGDLENEFVDPDVFEALLGGAEFEFEVTLPGRPVEHNASSVDGNTFTWEIDLADPVTELYAETEPGTPGGSSSSWIWIVVVLVAVAAAVAAGFVLMRRRSGSGGAGGGSTPGSPGRAGTLPPPSPDAPAAPSTAGPPPSPPAASPTPGPPPSPPAAPPTVGRPPADPPGG